MSMRGIVLRESLAGRRVPTPFPAVLTRSYPHLLDKRIPVEVLEFSVAARHAASISLTLAAALVPGGFYAHLLNEETMIVIFPRCVVQVTRGDEASARTARRVGALYAIPERQMQFQAMFSTDHPDSAPEPSGSRGAGS